MDSPRDGDDVPRRRLGTSLTEQQGRTVVLQLNIRAAFPSHYPQSEPPTFRISATSGGAQLDAAVVEQIKQAGDEVNF